MKFLLGKRTANLARTGIFGRYVGTFLLVSVVVFLRVLRLKYVPVDHNVAQAFQIFLIFLACLFYVFFSLISEKWIPKLPVIRSSLLVILLVLVSIGLWQEIVYLFLISLFLCSFIWFHSKERIFDKFLLSVTNPVSFFFLAVFLFVQLVVNEYCFVNGYGDTWIHYLFSMFTLYFFPPVLAEDDAAIKIVAKLVDNFKKYRSWSVVESSLYKFPYSTYSAQSAFVVPQFDSRILLQNFGLYNRILNTSFFGMPFINTINGESPFLLPYKERYSAIIQWKNVNYKSVLVGLSKEECRLIMDKVDYYMEEVQKTLVDDFEMTLSKEIEPLVRGKAALVQFRNEVCQELLLPQMVDSFTQRYVREAIENSPDFGGDIGVALATDRSDSANLVVKVGGYKTVFTPAKLAVRHAETIGLASFYTEGCIELSTALGDKVIQDRYGVAVAYEHKVVRRDCIIVEAFEEYLRWLQSDEEFRITQKNVFKQEIVKHNIKKFVFVFQTPLERELLADEKDAFNRLRVEWIKEYSIPVEYIIKK